MARARKSSPHLTDENASVIKKHLHEGMSQHDIAAIFHVNQGRISEIKTGKEFREVPRAE